MFAFLKSKSFLQNIKKPPKIILLSFLFCFINRLVENIHNHPLRHSLKTLSYSLLQVSYELIKLLSLKTCYQNDTLFFTSKNHKIFCFNIDKFDTSWFWKSVLINICMTCRLWSHYLLNRYNHVHYNGDVDLGTHNTNLDSRYHESSKMAARYHFDITWIYLMKQQYSICDACICDSVVGRM